MLDVSYYGSDMFELEVRGLNEVHVNQFQCLKLFSHLSLFGSGFVNRPLFNPEEVMVSINTTKPVE